ncbi:MAG: hypothetical protein KBT48_02905 [Firmicutes bacterium]|nr:hypothetical protein [Bacillota bacterium]
MRNNLEWIQKFRNGEEVKVGKIYSSLFVYGQQEIKGEFFVKDHKNQSYLIQQDKYYFLIEGDVLAYQDCILAEHKTYGYFYNSDNKHYKIDPTFITRIEN